MPTYIQLTENLTDWGVKYAKIKERSPIEAQVITRDMIMVSSVKLFWMSTIIWWLTNSWWFRRWVVLFVMESFKLLYLYIEDRQKSVVFYKVVQKYKNNRVIHPIVLLVADYATRWS